MNTFPGANSITVTKMFWLFWCVFFCYCNVSGLFPCCVQEFGKVLNGRIVTYINMDQPVLGNYSLRVASTPTLHNIIYNAAERVRYFVIWPAAVITRVNMS